MLIAKAVIKPAISDPNQARVRDKGELNTFILLLSQTDGCGHPSLVTPCRGERLIILHSPGYTLLYSAQCYSSLLFSTLLYSTLLYSTLWWSEEAVNDSNHQSDHWDRGPHLEGKQAGAKVVGGG